jgi:hypothetical protein
LPPITVHLLRDGAKEEIRVDAVARCGDLLRDLSAGGPEPGLFERLGLGATPRRRTPRAVTLRIVGLSRKGSLLAAHEELEEAGLYELVVEQRDLAGDAAEQLIADTAAALGVTNDDSSDWSADEREPNC